jgi:hypothetical protein
VLTGRQVLHIYPGSVVYKYKQPEWVVFHEVVHTTKKYMRDITVIDPAWLTDVACVPCLPPCCGVLMARRPHFYEWRKRKVDVAPGQTVGEILRSGATERPF